MTPPRIHEYAVTVEWTGNDGDGTRSYGSYRRDHEVSSGVAPTLLGSADPAFRGDPARWNPEQLLVASLSQCHMLWYLHLCSRDRIIVESYRDAATGTMAETDDGAGQFTSVTLRPSVWVRDASTVAAALALHHDVPALCFIARSVNFPVHHEPIVSPSAPPPRS